MIMVTMRPGGGLREGLEEFVATLPVGCTVVEIGSYQGESAKLFMARAARIFCIDPWQNYSDRADVGCGGLIDCPEAEVVFDLLARDHPYRVVKLKMTGAAARLLFEPRSVDVVYIDANHEEIWVRAEVMAWLDVPRPGGWIAGHDYGHPDYSGVKRAVDGIFGKPDRLFWDMSWAVRVP